MQKVFIDGSSGTTGLKIYNRLSQRNDIDLISLPENLRKDVKARKEAINSSDIAFLCLPDQAAKEAVELVDNGNTVIIDTSTAHRTAEGWTYGFAELTGQREKISVSKRIANPGCHASGFIALVKPLTELGVLTKDAFISCFSLTGYSGGGKKMIAEYEGEEKNILLDSPRQYGLSQQHKHLPEMTKICGLKKPPAFCPVVADYYSGMEVTVTLFKEQLNGNLNEIITVYKDYYKNGTVKYVDNSDESGFLAANSMSGFDSMEISAFGNDERILLVSRFDNLGKGASGAAIQNMNIVLGADEAAGLNIK